MNKKNKIKNTGSALPLVMVAIIILLTMGTALLSMGLSNRIYSMRNTSDIVARCAADAGLTQALFEMNEKLQASTLSGSELPAALNQDLLDCDAEYSYLVKGSLAGGYNVISLGKSDNSQRMITASLGLQGIFDHAILTKKSLILKSGTTVDGYNSKDATDTDNDVKIGTQSTADDSMILNSGVIVYGDVAVGDGKTTNVVLDDVIKDLGATVENKLVATEVQNMPEISPPATLSDMKTSLTAKGTTLTLTSSDSGIYTEINLQKSSSAGVLEVAEGEDVELYITGDIELDQNCEILVHEGATLTIYVDGDILCREGSGINTEVPPEEASTLQLYGTGDDGQSLQLRAKDEWTGLIYAPDADVVLYAGSDVYGSVTADTFEFKAGGDFYYDEALKDVKIGDPGVVFTVTRWNESKISIAQSDFSSIKIDDIGVLQENDELTQESISALGL